MTRACFRFLSHMGGSSISFSNFYKYTLITAVVIPEGITSWAFKWGGERRQKTNRKLCLQERTEILTLFDIFQLVSSTTICLGKI